MHHLQQPSASRITLVCAVLLWSFPGGFSFVPLQTLTSSGAWFVLLSRDPTPVCLTFCPCVVVPVVQCL